MFLLYTIVFVLLLEVVRGSSIKDVIDTFVLLLDMKYCKRDA